MCINSKVNKIVSLILLIGIITLNFTGLVYADEVDLQPQAEIGLQPQGEADSQPQDEIGLQLQTEASDVLAEIFVAVNGSDTDGDGSRESPFATIAKAKEKVRQIKQSLPEQKMTGDIIVYIGAGDYYLNETIVFDENDSGTNGYKVIYRSADGIGAANLIGGDRITGWTLATEEDVEGFDLDASLVGKVYKVQLNKEKYNFNTLYVNDRRAVMARTKNRDNNPNFPMAKGEYLRSVGGHNNDFNMIYKPGDLDAKAIAGMANAQARGEKEIAQVFVWDGGDWDWFTNTVPIEKINVAANELKFPRDPSYPEKYRTKYNIGTGARYFLQGNLAFMDVEGEYHYNKSTGVLYYYPKAADGDIEDQVIVAPTMQEVIKFKGADKLNDEGKLDLAAVPDPEKQVHDIVIDGLGIKNTEFADYYSYSWNWGDGFSNDWIGYFPKEAEGSSNPSYCETAERPEFRVGSVTLTDANNITILNCRVKNAGMYGIVFAGDNQYNRVENSVVEYTGNGGIMFDGGYPGIGKYNNHNTIYNVLIHDVGELVGHAVGFTLMSSGQNNVTHLEVYNTPKRAILLIGGYRRDRNGADKDYDEIKDMYTVGNHFKYIYVHDAQQDAGEDSAVFLSWLLAGKDVLRLHGSNDPNNLKTNLDGIDTTIDRYNYFEQMLIANIGADPSVIEKCTSGGLDTAMGASGSQFKNVRAVNTQSHLLAIRHRDSGGYNDVYGIENVTNNIYDNEWSHTFDDSVMEYDKLGITADFPSELRSRKKDYPQPPSDIYFSDDFEDWTGLDLTKWTVEKGQLDMTLGRGYVSEDPLIGKASLPINADLNRNGIVVGRRFKNQLNKIVEVKYMDLRKDYAVNDRNDAVPTEILPNSFIRVDDGETALGLGAVGTASKDYYFIKKGEELIQTNVKRSFGWHTFKFDYTSGTDVKLYIDDQLVGTYPATSFNYIGMGDWEGRGGKAYFDQLYVYGGQYAPPVEDLELPPPPAESDRDLYYEDFNDGETDGWEINGEGALCEVIDDPANPNNKIWYVQSPDHQIYTHLGDANWSNYIFECKVKLIGWNVNEESKPWDNLGIGFYANPKGRNHNRYTMRINRETGKFQIYKRQDGDFVLAEKNAPEGFNAYDWNTYRVEIIDGYVTTYINGVQMFKLAMDAASGGIGFDGINVKFYVDDISVIKAPTQAPVADKRPGTYDSPISVNLVPSSASDRIYYTTNGLDPVIYGKLFHNKPVLIDKTTTLKIVAVNEGNVFSDVVAYNYIISGTQPNEPETGVNKAALRAKLEEADSISRSNYSDESWNTFIAARANARNVLDTATTEVEIISAMLSLQTAIERLIPGQVVSYLYAEDFNDFDVGEFTDSNWIVRNSGTLEKSIVADISGNKVLKVKSSDNQLVTNVGNENWKNYTFECRAKIDNWNVNTESKPWDNFGVMIYVGEGNIVSRYSLKLNRVNLNEFQLYKRSNGDFTLKTVPAPEGYDPADWNTYKFQINNGVLTAYVNDVKVFEHEDTQLTFGGVGFDGINVEYYVDDITVIPRLTEEPEVDIESGTYEAPVNVTVTPAASGDKIYYTTDGTDPVMNGKSYSKPINIASSCSLKVVSVNSAGVFSSVVSYDYTIVNGMSQMPVIFAEPRSRSVTEGQSVTFEVMAASPDNGLLAYQWQISTDNGTTWQDIDGQTGSKYTTDIVTVAADNGKQFRCIVRNIKDQLGISSVSTRSAVLTVKEMPWDTAAPVISAIYARRISNAAAEVKFSSSKAGQYYYEIVDDGASVPEINTDMDGIACIEGENVISLNSLTTAGAKDIYIVVKDSEGNLSNILKLDIPEYNPDQQPGYILAGGEVEAGDTYTTTLSIYMPENTASAIYAQDITIVYDPDVFEFEDIDSEKNGLNVLVDSDTAGIVRILLISLGSQNGINSDTDLIDIKFKAKNVPSTRSSIYVSEAIIADGDGNETEIGTSLAGEVLIINADINADGRVSIGDLGIIGRFYGNNVASVPEASAADVNCDGVVGLEDLVLVARKILAI